MQNFIVKIPFRHPEKVAKAKIALLLPYGASDLQLESFISKWDSLKNRIDSERKQFLEEARTDLNRRKWERSGRLGLESQRE